MAKPFLASRSTRLELGQHHPNREFPCLERSSVIWHQVGRGLENPIGMSDGRHDAVHVIPRSESAPRYHPDTHIHAKGAFVGHRLCIASCPWTTRPTLK